MTYFFKEPEDFDDKVDWLLLHVNHNKVKMKEPDYEALCPCFAWAPADIMKKTLEAATQYAWNSYNLPFCSIIAHISLLLMLIIIVKPLLQIE